MELGLCLYQGSVKIFIRTKREEEYNGGGNTRKQRVVSHLTHTHAHTRPQMSSSVIWLLLRSALSSDVGLGPFIPAHLPLPVTPPSVLSLQCSEYPIVSTIPAHSGADSALDQHQRRSITLSTPPRVWLVGFLLLASTNTCAWLSDFLVPGFRCVFFFLFRLLSYHIIKLACFILVTCRSAQSKSSNQTPTLSFRNVFNYSRACFLQRSLLN